MAKFFHWTLFFLSRVPLRFDLANEYLLLAESNQLSGYVLKKCWPSAERYNKFRSRRFETKKNYQVCHRSLHLKSLRNKENTRNNNLSSSSFFSIVGFVIYLFYGYWHSLEGVKPTENLEDGGVRILQETPNIEQNINIPQLELPDGTSGDEFARKHKY